MPKTKQKNTCTYNHLPEDEPSGSKHVEDIVKKLIYYFNKYAFCLFIFYEFWIY